jgi:hypothetical protein
MGTGGTFPGEEQAGREAVHLLPSSAEVKNASNYTFAPQYICVFMAWFLVEHSDKNFTLHHLKFLWVSQHIHGVRVRDF